jgi:hypothetical protein
MELAASDHMHRWINFLVAWLVAAGPAGALYETLSLTDAVGRDSVTVRVGETFEVSVRLNTNGTAISGFQCFLTINESIAVPVPYNQSSTGLFRDNVLFPGIVLFADNHDLRFPNNPLPHHQLDWCYQTGTGNPRPAYVANGTACFFRLRFLQPAQFTLRFDHDNNNFRNTLFWAGQSAIENPFYREYGIHFNVVGMNFGPLPDVYLTSTAPCDSINLVDYMEQIEGLPADSVWYSWSPLGPNTTCTVDSLRQAGAYWLKFCATGPGRSVDLAVTAHALNLTATDTLRVFRGDPPVIHDEMAQGNPFVTWPEDGETWLDFDDWVTDLDDPVSDLVWSVVPGDHIVSLVIDPALRRGHFSAPPDWFGWDTLTVRVTDPGGMMDSSPLIVHVTPVNDPPVLDLPALIQVHPGQPLVVNLEAITTDIDNVYADLYWQVTGDTTLIAMRIHPVQHTLTLEVQPGAPLWSFVDASLRVTDLGGLWDEDPLHLQVASHPPLWQPLGEILVASGGSVTVNLNDFVSDEDNPDSELQLSILDNNNIQVTIHPLTHIATFSAPGVFAGVERLRALARDPDGNTDVDTFLVVALQGGNPLVALLPDLIFMPGARDSLDLDRHVWDMDTPDELMTWTVTNSGLFHTVVRPETRRVVYTAPLTPGAIDVSWYRATDPQGHWGEDAGSLAVIDPSGRPVIFPLDEVWMRVDAVDSSIVLDRFVYDYDHTPAQLSWTLAPGNLVQGTIRPSDRKVFLTSGFNSGTETLALTVTDPDQRSASGGLVVHVTEGNPPIVSAFAPRFVIAGQTDTLRNLTNWVYDPDPGDRIVWTFIDPPDSPVRTVWLPQLDRALIHTDSLTTGTVRIGALAQDMAQNTDLEWITLTMLENRPPLLESAVLANPGEARQLDLVVMSNEALRSVTARRVGDGHSLALAELVVANPIVRLFRADLPMPQGVETWRIEGRDLPGFPQVAGNLGVDSLVLGGGVLGGPGDQLPSPDGRMALHWCSGLSNGGWAIREESGTAERRWTLIGPLEGRARATAADGLERLGSAGWEALPAEGRAAEVQPGDRLRPAGDGVALRPAGLSLAPAVPNPFNPATLLRLETDRSGPARLEIVDLAGRRVRTLWSASLEAGAHSVRWDGLDGDGLPAASGVYFARLRQGERQAVQKLMLVR